MIRQQLPRLAFALAASLLCSSFALRPVPKAGPELETESSAYRVTRRFAAGLEYLLVEPRALPQNAELPMLVYIHGRSSVPTAPDEPFFGVEEPVRIILPRGPDRSGHGYAWMPVSARGGETPPLTNALVDRAETLARAMTEWRRRHPTRGRPIVMGFSQGGMLAMELAVHHPASIAEAIPLAGWLPPSRTPASPRDPYSVAVPVHAIHGTADPILAAGRSEATVERLRELGYPVDFEAIEGAAHEVTPRMRARARARVEEALRRLPETGRAAGRS